MQNLRKIAKEAMKNLVEEPNTYFKNLKKDSMHSTSKRVESDEANKSNFKQHPCKQHYQTDEEKS